MYTRVTKKALLLLAAGLLLTGCNTDPVVSDSNGNESATSLIEDSNNSENPTTSESSEKSSIDYTQGWDAEIDAEIRRNLGGNGLPYFDMSGEINIVHVDKTSTSNAHILITSTCAFDTHLVYRAKTQFEKAGWAVSYNNQTDPSLMRMDAENEEAGITLAMFGKKNSRDNSYYPAIECYFTEIFREPGKDTTWSNNTLSVLNEVGIHSPHMLPYVYMGALNDTATKVTARKALIKGGDWINYEKKILGVARKRLSSSQNWAETPGSVSSYGHYSSTTYTFTKVFSDGYKLEAKLYGDAADGSYSSLSADDVVAYLEVVVTNPKK